MTLHKNHGLLTVECDCCDEVLDPDTKDFNMVLEAIRENGWTAVKNNKDEWEHRCPNCK